jgi:iron complex outermembrane recepter protein
VKKALFLMSAVSSIALSANPAWAQHNQAPPQEETSALSLNDAIVVTARRRAEDISKVPVAISAFSGEQLESKSVVNIADLVKITPGVNIAGGGARTNPFITIRGQTRGVTGNIQAGVTTYMNEVPLPTLGSLIPTYDVDNIQVLKGPQGTLFGRNSIGGAVLVYSKAPVHEFGGYAKVDIASYNFKQFEGAINVPIVQDVIALRLATQIYHDGGFSNTSLVTDYTVDPTTGIASPGHIEPLKHNLDEFSVKLFRASLLIEPSDSIKNVTVFDYGKIRGLNNSQFGSFYPRGFNGANPAVFLLPEATIRGPAVAGRFGAAYAQSIINLAQCGYSFICDYKLAQKFSDSTRDTQFINSDPWRSRTILWGVTNTTTAQLGDNATLKNIFGYRSTDLFSNGDNEGSPLFVVQTGTQTNLRQITDELQLSGDVFDKKLHYTVGGFYYNEAPTGPGGNQALEVNALQGLSHSIITTYLTNASKAVYGQFDYSFDNLVEGLGLTAGVRQTWDSVKGCTSNVTFAPTAKAFYIKSPNDPIIMTESECDANSLTTADFPGSRSVTAQRLAKAEFKKLTYTLGVNWQINSNILTYVVRRRGYRAGNYNTPLFDPYLTDVQTFKPEVLEDWEFGTKIRWRSGGMRGSFDLALFSGKDKGNQFVLPTSGLGAGICVPAAVGSAGRASNCTTAGGVPGVRVVHSAASTAINGGDLTIRGFEAAATFSPIDGVTLGAGVAHVDYKVDRINLPGSLLSVLQAAGTLVPSTIILFQQPKWTYNFDLNVNLPKDVLGTDVSWTLNFKHSDKFFMGDGTVKAYDVADTRVTFPRIAGSPVDLAFYVRNLTNEDYNFGTSVSNASTLGANSYIRAQPRTFGLSVKYNFGE